MKWGEIVKMEKETRMGKRKRKEGKGEKLQVSYTISVA